MANRRRRRKNDKERRHAPKAVRPLVTTDGCVGDVKRLVYSREQAAHALGISLATLDRRVVPAIGTVKTEWGTRLIPATELERYLAERTKQPQTHRTPGARAGRRSMLPPELVARIQRERSDGASLAEIARRLNRDEIPTGQNGRQWWPSTVRAVLSEAKG